MAKKKQPAITNTEKESHIGFPFIDSNDVYAQEAQGQRELVKSTQMPTEINGRYDPPLKAGDVYKAFGFAFIAGSKGELPFTSKGDELFMDVELPKGWEKRGSNHDMWSYVYDEYGRKRISVFYKAAFYDRRANINVEPQFTVHVEYVYPEGKNCDNTPWQERDTLPVYAAVKTANGAIQYVTPKEDSPIDGMERMRLQEKVRKLAESWLYEHYPHWREPLAYWDRFTK